MPVGTLVRWTDDRGFGFIRPDDAQSSDVFVHIRELKRAGVEDPIEGDAYEYAIGQRNGRDIATALYRIHRAADAQ